jgi:predicted GNAT superfamily acetyltransferase
MGLVIYSPLDWEHAHFPTGLKGGLNGNALELASQIQETVFGIHHQRDVMPPFLISNIAKTGGSAFVAYTEAHGFTEEGWLGFGFVFGGRHHSLQSTFLGVRKESRSKSAIGFHLRLLQANAALANGFTRIEWVQGPLRGEIAKLSLSKLGAVATTFTPDKCRGLDYGLYGVGTTDRITVEWDLLLSQTQEKINNFALGGGQRLTFEEVQGIPVVTGSNVKSVEHAAPLTLLYEIPENADELEAERKIAWRDDMCKVFEALMDTECVEMPIDVKNDPALMKKTLKSGKYQISDFVTGFIEGQRKSFYVFTKK